MGARGRPSLGGLSNVATTGATLKQRPKPWPGLTHREIELWKFVVNSQAVDWFSPADQPILMGYVRAIALHERISLEAFGAPLIVPSAAGAEIANPIFKLQNTAALAMASLATKLRLTQSSRMTDGNARTKAKNAGITADAGKPWEKAA